jgi:hypothetical protein
MSDNFMKAAPEYVENVIETWNPKGKKFQIIPYLSRNDFSGECCFWETAFSKEPSIFPSWNRKATAFAY